MQTRPPLAPSQLIKKRPLSPDVLEIDNKTPHYKFPLGALSSIMNRVTGAVLSVGEPNSTCVCVHAPPLRP